MFSERQTHDRPLIWLTLAYVIAVLFLVCASTRLWWQSPLNLTAHEFDYFLGLFSSSDSGQAQLWLARGRIVHFVGCLLVGMLYFALVTRFLRNPEFLTNRGVVCYSALVSLIFAAGMPWVSPDVFYYIGKGWSESHYGVSPYFVPINHLPGYQTDQMFSNIFPGFLYSTTGYGPLFQKGAEGIAALSGGSEKLALALHKGMNLGLHGVSSVLVYRLAPRSLARVAGLSYALNPLICFSVLTCAHNDQWMNMFMLFALLSLSRRHWTWTGVALGAAFGVKYFPLVYVPIIAFAALMQRSEERDLTQRLADTARFILGFLATITASFLLFYPEAVRDFASTLSSGGMLLYRNSIYHVVNMMSAVVLPELFGTRPFLLSYQHLGDMGANLRMIYMVIYVAVLLLMLRRLRRDTFTGTVEACLIATILYFIIANTSNQEWYLTWLIGLALVLPYAHARSLAWRLSAYFLPLVIYTVKSGSLFVELLSNAILYLLVLALGCHYLWCSREKYREEASLHD